MANIKSAIKRAKLSEERRAHNASIKSDMRSAVKTVEALVTNNDLENAKEAFKTASKNLTKQLVKVLSTKRCSSSKISLSETSKRVRRLKTIHLDRFCVITYDLIALRKTRAQVSYPSFPSSYYNQLPLIL